MRRADVRRIGDMIVFDFEASAFYIIWCVTSSALVYVGQGKQPPEWMDDLLNSRDRTRAALTFEADGLYLIGVRYEEHWGHSRRSFATNVRKLLMTGLHLTLVCFARWLPELSGRNLS